MKYLIVIVSILISQNAMACLNYIAKSEIPSAIALTPGVGGKVCGDSDPCICFDGIAWEAANWDGTNLTNDATKLANFKAARAAAKAAEIQAAADQAAAIDAAKSAVKSANTQADKIQALLNLVKLTNNIQ